MAQFNRFLFPVLVLLMFCMFTGPSYPSVQNHPADEGCATNTKMDPELCKALAAAQTDEPPVEMKRPTLDTIGLYIRLGYIHILPRGTDHILFVLALFLASTRLKPLFVQISIFTVAHTLTLALAASGHIKAPASVIEPLIAFSIAFVAIENLFFKDMTKWRPLIVFGFGLFHGLGFASVLVDMGLPKDQFLTSLVSFNVGVELGQISIIIGAWSLLHWWYKKDWYRPYVVIPISLSIAVMGLIWGVQRLHMG